MKIVAITLSAAAVLGAITGTLIYHPNWRLAVGAAFVIGLVVLLIVTKERAVKP